jgi:hypothetical protein
MTFTGIPFWAVAGLLVGSAGALGFLHLLKILPRRVRVVTTLFWAHAAERATARTLLERFRHPVTYALLLLICSLVVLALGRPERVSAGSERQSRVLILNAGASMSAADPSTGRPRLDAAREVLLNEAKILAPDDFLAVIVADPWPRLAHAFGDPRPALPRRLAQVTPAALPADTDASLALAASLIRNRPNPMILLVTDRPVDDSAAATPQAGAPVRVARVGAPVPNAAILSAQFEPAPDNPFLGTLRIRIGGWAASPARVRVRIQRAGGAPLADSVRTISPGATDDVMIPRLRPDGDTLLVDLSGDDAVLADSHAAFRLPLRRRVRVHVAPAVPRAMTVLLKSAPEIDILSTHGNEDLAITVAGDTDPPGVPAIVLAGRGPEVAQGSAVQTRPGSPWVRGLQFEDALCGRGPSLVGLPDKAEPILLSGEQVLAAVSGYGPTQRLWISPALVAEGSTLPNRAGFAVFMIRSIRRLAGWEEDPVVLTPERALQDPLLVHRPDPATRVVVAPGSRTGSDLAATAAPSQGAGTGGRTFRPELFELLLGLALGLAVLEAVMHARGKIA